MVWLSVVAPTFTEKLIVQVTGLFLSKWDCMLACWLTALTGLWRAVRAAANASTEAAQQRINQGYEARVYVNLCDFQCPLST